MIRHKLNWITVRAELVEAQESNHISTSSMRTDSRLSSTESIMVNTACPCGGSDYASCCGRYHQQLNVPDAASLMRSRYSAYVLKQEGYLLATWHPSTRPAALDLASDHSKWLGLKVKKHVAESATRAAVEFVARYKIAGKAHRLHEISRFVFEENKWFYLDGEFPNA